MATAATPEMGRTTLLWSSLAANRKRHRETRKTFGKTAFYTEAQLVKGERALNQRRTTQNIFCASAHKSCHYYLFVWAAYQLGSLRVEPNADHINGQQPTRTVVRALLIEEAKENKIDGSNSSVKDSCQLLVKISLLPHYCILLPHCA